MNPLRGHSKPLPRDEKGPNEAVLHREVNHSSLKQKDIVEKKEKKNTEKDGSANTSKRDFDEFLIPTVSQKKKNKR